MKKVISIIVAALAVAVLAPAAEAEAHYFQTATAREYLWGYYNHDPDVQTKRAAIERERDVDIVDTRLIQEGFHVNNSDHVVRAAWRFVRACYPGCGPDDFGSTAGFYDRSFTATLGANGLVTDGPDIPN